MQRLCKLSRPTLHQAGLRTRSLLTPQRSARRAACVVVSCSSTEDPKDQGNSNPATSGDRSASGLMAPVLAGLISLATASAAHAETVLAHVDHVEDVFDLAIVTPDDYPFLAMERFGWMVVFPCMIIWMLYCFEKDAIAREQSMDMKDIGDLSRLDAERVLRQRGTRFSEDTRRIMAQAAARRILRTSRIVRESCYLQLASRSMLTDCNGMIEWELVCMMLDSVMNPLSGETERTPAPKLPEGVKLGSVDDVCNYIAGRAAEEAALKEVMLLIDTVTKDEWLVVLDYISLEAQEEDEFRADQQQQLRR